VRPSILYPITALLSLAAPLVCNAAEMKATGISLPFFDQAGKLTHRLLAKTGTMAGGIQKLHGVELHYFAPEDPKVIVQKLEAGEATWDEKKETLVGSGPIVVATIEHHRSAKLAVIDYLAMGIVNPTVSVHTSVILRVAIGGRNGRSQQQHRGFTRHHHRSLLRSWTDMPPDKARSIPRR